MDKLWVTGCIDCPFRHSMSHDILDEDGDWDGEYETHWCDAPDMKMQDIIEMEDILITPSNCPLFKNDITISIKKANEIF